MFLLPNLYLFKYLIFPGTFELSSIYKGFLPPPSFLCVSNSAISMLCAAIFCVVDELLFCCTCEIVQCLLSMIYLTSGFAYLQSVSDAHLQSNYLLVSLLAA